MSGLLGGDLLGTAIGWFLHLTVAREGFTVIDDKSVGLAVASTTAKVALITGFTTKSLWKDLVVVRGSGLGGVATGVGSIAGAGSGSSCSTGVAGGRLD